ncbi:hypothetical protein [Oceanobacillus senegalensis]|nr:hypothetical protein [Oceanobacillus senegalensis]
MVQGNNRNKKITLAVFFVVAGILDIKYKGLFYKLLPSSIQMYLTNSFK